MSYDIISMKSIAADLNDRTFTDYYYRLMLIARSVFKWNNLPNGIDEKWIERYLFTEGNCLFFKDKEKGYIVTKCTPCDNLNYYDEPIKLKPYGTNYIGTELVNNEECVLIRNNDCMLPTAPTIQLYALRLADTTRAIDVNINAQKTPVTIMTNQKTRLSLVNAYKKVTGNEPVIYVDKSLDMDNIKVLNTEAPAVFDKLQLQKHNIWNECMSFLGINNANMDKRERLVADEVAANNDQIEISAQVMLKAREKACELINSVFKLETPISVEMRVMPEKVIKVGDEE